MDHHYEIKEIGKICLKVGQGAYGIVVSGRHREDKNNIAIKKIENSFEHKIFAKRTLRELKLLRLI